MNVDNCTIYFLRPENNCSASIKKDAPGSLRSTVQIARDFFKIRLSQRDGMQVIYLKSGTMVYGIYPEPQSKELKEGKNEFTPGE